MAMTAHAYDAPLSARCPAATPLAKPRLQWGAALRALRKLLNNKEDTTQVFEIMRALNGTSTARGYERLLTTVEALVARAPAFEEAKVRRGWAGFYEVTPDDNPLLGWVGEPAGLAVAAGFSGHGFMQGPAIGACLAELILDGAARTVDISAFRPSRFAEGALAPEHNVI